MVTSMGPLASVEVVRPMLEEVLDYWLTALHQAPPAGAFGVAAQRLSLVQHDQQQSWPRSAVWVAMKTVFGLLKVCSHHTRKQRQLCLCFVDSTCMHAGDTAVCVWVDTTCLHAHGKNSVGMNQAHAF